MSKQSSKKPPSYDSDEKRNCGLYLPERLIAKMQDVVFYTPGMTMSNLAEQGIELKIQRIEEERGPIPRRPEGQSVPKGRPIS